jgi:outer membrane protein TolC
MYKIKSLLFGFFLLPALINAQSVLTLKDVIDSTLNNSFDIRIAENNLLISRKYNHYGVAGGLPQISASASDNIAVNDIYQSFSDGSENTSGGVRQNSFASGIDMGITLFNGFKITATKERLSLLEKQNEYLLNYSIQSALALSMIKYYDVIRQQHYLKMLEHLLEVSVKKRDIVYTRKQVGMASGVDILQAEMDVNVASENLKQQQLVVEHTKADLMLAMCSKKHFPFTVNDSIYVNSNLNIDSIIGGLNNNPLYLSAMQQALISEQMAKEAAANFYPSLKLGASYDYMINDNSAGSILTNRLYGPSAGFTLQIPIYYGGIHKAQRQAAVIGVSSARLMEESTRRSLENSAIKLFQTYTKNREQTEEQLKNFERAKELVELVLINFSLNKATIFDVNAAESSYENTYHLLISTQYAAKTAEIQLLAMMLMLK